MNVQKFIIYGTPIAKGRPKFAKRGNFVSTYTPEKTVNYENLVKLSYQQQCSEYFENEELSMSLDLYFDIPKSTSKKKRQQMIDKELRHTKRPDIDNIVKSISDALNGVAFKDDSQIVHLVVNKYYGEQPRVEAVIGVLINE